MTKSHSIFRRIALACLLPALFATTTIAKEGADTSMDDLILFRIANGPTSGTYYPIGGLLASAISTPPGATDCADGGACGVPGLLASALASRGSISNINALAERKVESAFAQSDIAFWAQAGNGIWSDKTPVEDLRAIGQLYPEMFHVITRKNSGIETLSDLKGRRVSVDSVGSGTRVDAELILQMVGLESGDLELYGYGSKQASQYLIEGRIDAMFFVGGYPSPFVTELASKTDLCLLEIPESVSTALAEKYDFFRTNVIPQSAYPGLQNDIETVSVGALWVTLAEQDDDLIYALTRLLWNDNTLKTLRYGHETGHQILRKNALDGVMIPLHPGAERYYREAGLLD